VLGNQLAAFSGKPRYAIKLPEYLKKCILSPQSDVEKKLVADLPKDIIAAAKTSQPYPLDEQNTLVLHYKKDDWQLWAYPMIYAILDDVILLEKLKLADMAALDGAISNIRIFRLGSLEHKLVPTEELAQKLAEVLQNNVGGGTTDIVWGADIDLLESKTQVHHFLGEEKYKPTLNSIYAGLGIPPTLTGTYGAAGTTNNFVSLKTLTERLQYGRDIMTRFWKKEIKMVQEAMSYRYPADIEFDFMALGNEEAEKQLLFSLCDRNLISDELLQRRFGHNPEMENVRIMREHKQRNQKRRAPKPNSLGEPTFENEARKIVLQSGLATPSQVGLELDPKKPGEKSGSDIEVKMAELQIKLGELNLKRSQFQAKQAAKKPAGQPGQGRPKNKKDSTKRKTKVVRPRTRAAIQTWAKHAQDSISEHVNPLILKWFNKKDLRSLTEEEFSKAEHIKFGVLYNMEPFSTVNGDTVALSVKAGSIPDLVLDEYNRYIDKCNKENGNLTTEDKRDIQAYFYAVLKDG
jgi:hypothetical protein